MPKIGYSDDVSENLSELNKLLELAESISESIEKGNDLILRQNTYFGSVAAFVSIAALASATALESSISKTDSFQIVFGLSVFLTIVVAYYSLYSSFKSKSIRKNIEIDRRILGDLVDMISSLSRRVQGRISSVDYALITMRMRRISLSPDEYFFHRSP